MWGGMVNRPRRSLIRAHYLTGDQKYLEAALALTSLAVGDNPQNLCYTTSLGSRWPKSPLHIDSFVTGQPAPPGITLAGPVDSTGFWAEGFVEHVEPHVYPPITEWPPLETFWNMLWYVLIAEYTVQHPMAETAFVYGYFASRPCAWPCR
jgi:endoglucanase